MASKAEITPSFEESLCKVLKLDPNKIISITIKVKKDDFVTVTTEHALYEEEGQGLLKLCKYYNLLPIQDENKPIKG